MEIKKEIVYLYNSKGVNMKYLFILWFWFVCGLATSIIIEKEDKDKSFVGSVIVPAFGFIILPTKILVDAVK